MDTRLNLATHSLNLHISSEHYTQLTQETMAQVRAMGVFYLSNKNEQLSFPVIID
jgi:hypothetical protein